MSDTKIQYTFTDNVTCITMSDPATLNAASLELVEALIASLTCAVEDKARCILLTGEGKGFSSGANLNRTGSSQQQSGSKIDVGAALISHYNPLILAIRDLPCPFITAVNGPAAGVGCSIALMGDMILASENAYFLQAFRRIGLVPDGGSTYMLPRMIGRVRAMEMMLLGNKIPAEQAYEWGMINRVCSPDTLMDEAMELAKNLATGPTLALAKTRQLLWAGLDTSFETQLFDERIEQREAGRTDDAKEGITAFLQKRQAEFKGQ